MFRQLLTGLVVVFVFFGCASDRNQSLTFRGNSRWKIHDDPVVPEGSILFTRRTLLGATGIRNSWVHPYARIRVVVIDTQPVVRIGAASLTMTRARMDDFNWPADIRNIPIDTKLRGIL